jgi:hypothetical protein
MVVIRFSIATTTSAGMAGTILIEVDVPMMELRPLRVR